jgi:hypothetical protein
LGGGTYRTALAFAGLQPAKDLEMLSANPFEAHGAATRRHVTMTNNGMTV